MNDKMASLIHIIYKNTHTHTERQRHRSDTGTKDSHKKEYIKSKLRESNRWKTIEKERENTLSLGFFQQHSKGEKY